LNLTNYFYSKYNESQFPYYARLIKFYKQEQWEKYPCEYIDDDEIISRWKSFTHPSSFDDDDEYNFEFLILSFYLLNEGYMIQEHPNLLFKIDTPASISEGIFKDATRIKYGTKPNGAVAWADRRRYSNSLAFIKKNNSIPFSSNINDIFKLVSPSNKNFNEMSLDEKLAQIRNVFSYLGKTSSGYINLDIEKISNGYISSEQLKAFQKDLQCFRHGEKDMIEKRDSYSEAQKKFMIDYGLMLINVTEEVLKTKE